MNDRFAPTDETALQKLQLVARLERQIRAFGDGLATESTPDGISPVEWLALSQLYTNSGMSLTVLAKSLVMRVSSASRLLQNLAERELVEFRRFAGDRRRYAIDLTPLGRQLLAAARPPSHGRMRCAMYRLSDEDLASATHILATCLEPDE